MTSSSVSVNDTVKAIVPSGSTLRAGYEYPASTQTSGAFVNIQISLGTYTKTFSGPFLPCQMRAKFNFIAGSYTENKVLKTRMNISGGTGYRTITASDVNNHQIAVEMVGLALSILVETLATQGFLRICRTPPRGPSLVPSGQFTLCRQIRLKPKRAAIFYSSEVSRQADIVIDQLYGSLGTLSSWPALAVGQYYRITTSVSGSTLTVSVRVWASRRMMMQAAVQLHLVAEALQFLHSK